MKAKLPKRMDRQAFTLIELLVVISIIGVLIGLLLSAVFKVLGRKDEVINRNDISEIAQGIENFKLKYGVDYIPSRLWLGKTKAAYDLSGNNQLHTDSFAYINRVWPRLNWGSGNLMVTHNWNNKAPAGYELRGEQVLVFFLGGVQINDVPMGFSTNPQQPDAVGGDRVNSFTFESRRLVTGPTPSNSSQFYLMYEHGYKDSDPKDKKPFLYFSAYKTKNGYDRYANLGPDTYQKAADNQLVYPYMEAWSPKRYYNSETYQIISAGRDSQFGTGTRAANTVFTGKGLALNNPGYDDMSNFYPNVLGIAIN
jgi:prepilin-type N-terminal cleavage/methylation domain-containing protein